MPSGTVIGLWRWPVAGMIGEQLISTRVDGRGVAGDRVHRIGSPPTPPDARLARWSATYPFTPDGAIDPDNPPYPNVHAPAGGEVLRWGDPWLNHALERDLRRRVETVRDLTTPRGVIVANEVPREPSLAGVNVQLDLEPPEGGWSGTVLAFENGVRLRLLTSRADGPGIETLVLAGGRLQVGEAVALG
jgi:hypothetical protein